MKKLLTEFIGTFFLVLVVGMTVTGGKGDFAPLAIGVSLMVMIFAGGHISGGHYNPAVTLAVLVRGKIGISDAVGYWVSQIIAAAAAAGIVTFLQGDKIAETAPQLANTTHALVAEFIGTFALAYVVLNVATAKGTAGNSFYGLAIGFTVLTMAYSFGSISNGAFNPSVAIGISLLKLVSWSDYWVYFIGCFGGAFVAALVFRFNNPDDK